MIANEKYVGDIIAQKYYVKDYITHRSRLNNGALPSVYIKLYGYEKNENGEYQIVPEQARVVKEIFTLYEHGESIDKIMNHLQSNHVPTPENCETWSMCTVRLMLQNERYCGDILLQSERNT